MRLWHQALIPYLDHQRLLSQHNECCALRGADWGKKHATVDYVFTHDPAYLFFYHLIVMKEMEKRGYQLDKAWYDESWRGFTLGNDKDFVNHQVGEEVFLSWYIDDIIYSEHDEAYLKECVNFLREENAECDWENIETMIMREGAII